MEDIYFFSFLFFFCTVGQECDGKIPNALITETNALYC